MKRNLFACFIRNRIFYLKKCRIVILCYAMKIFFAAAMCLLFILPVSRIYAGDEYADFIKNIKPLLETVNEADYLKSRKKSETVYAESGFTVKGYISGGDMFIDEKYLVPSRDISVQIFLAGEKPPYCDTEIYFIDTSGKINIYYRKKGVAECSALKRRDADAPFWARGSIALIYAPAAEGFCCDILNANVETRAAVLMFVPDKDINSHNMRAGCGYPYMDVVNMANRQGWLITDRNILSYFDKYGIKTGNTFNKYKGGGVVFNADVYIDKLIYPDETGDCSGKANIAALFMTEEDKGRGRRYSYQKSPYCNITVKEGEEYLLIYDKPNGNITGKIERSYRKEKDTLYAPWDNVYKDGVLWYCVIVPKLDKKGYVKSSESEIINGEYCRE